MIVCVETYKIDGDDKVFESRFHINDERDKGRKHLAAHAYWAMRSGRSVTIFAKEQE